jgi:D-amino-acid oxidase
MPWLVDRVRALGGSITRGSVASLADPFPRAAVVVNCAGLDAGSLADDPSVLPIRGQVVRLAPVPGVSTALVDEEGPRGLTYIVPRSADIVVGGTADVGGRSLAPDPATSRAILERARRLEPRLAGARVLSHAVGLRPGRPEVRLETEHLDVGAVVHNYGHGGAGFTLCWGCADEAAELAERVLAER